MSLKPKINITLKGDNRDEIIKTLHDRVDLALCAIGEKAEGYAKDNCPVDTGRLRNSITYATATKQGKAQTGRNSFTKGSRGDIGYIEASPEDYAVKKRPAYGEVYIGTNVEYAPQNEYDDMHHDIGRAHFLRDAATTHGDEYRDIVKKTLSD